MQMVAVGWGKITAETVVRCNFKRKARWNIVRCWRSVRRFCLIMDELVLQTPKFLLEANILYRVPRIEESYVISLLEVISTTNDVVLVENFVISAEPVMSDDDNLSCPLDGQDSVTEKTRLNLIMYIKPWVYWWLHLIQWWEFIYK